MKVKFKDFLNEALSTPDEIIGHFKKILESTDKDALSFAQNEDTGEWIFGGESDWGNTHTTTITMSYWDEEEKDYVFNANYISFGRFWLNSKVIIFWDYPFEVDFDTFILALSNRLKTDIWNNGWKIIVTDKNNKQKLITIEEYTYCEENDFSAEEREKHIANWKKREIENRKKILAGEEIVPKGLGSRYYDDKLPKDMTPVEYIDATTKYKYTESKKH